MSIANTFSRLLPPPTYISLPSVGVDISDTSLKYISFVPTLQPGKVRSLKQWGDISIPESVLQRGEIKDAKILTDVLKEFKAQTGAEYIRVSLPEERAYIFETQIKKNIPFKEVKNLLEFRLEENVPISAKEAIFDYEIVGDVETGHSVRVVVAAYQRDTILKYYEVCQAAGLIPISFEVESQAMARAVVPANFKDTVMLIDFGKTRTGIGIVNECALLYTSTIDIGGRHLSQALRKTVGDLPEDNLTEIKNTTGLVMSVKDSRSSEAMIPTISVIKDEIAAQMQYWHLRDNGNDIRRIKKLILCGGSVNLKGLPEYLTETLGVPCARGDVWVNAFRSDLTVPPIDKNHSYGYATAIGLALKSNV